MDGLTLKSFFHLSFTFSVVDYSITLHILGKNTLVATRTRNRCVVFFLLVIYFSISSKSRLTRVTFKSFGILTVLSLCDLVFLFLFCILLFNDWSLLFGWFLSVWDSSFTNDFPGGWSRYQPGLLLAVYIITSLLAITTPAVYSAAIAVYLIALSAKVLW